MLQRGIYSSFLVEVPQIFGCISKLSSYTTGRAAAMRPQAPPTRRHYLMHFTFAQIIKEGRKE